MDRNNSFSLIFSRKIGFYSVGFRVCGATRWVQPTWARQERGARPGGLCPSRCPSPVDLSSRNSYLLYKTSSQSFVPFRELLFLHKNNTMVVLLKTTSVRVSFIQIMQIRVQNKRKSVTKSRYDGDVSLFFPCFGLYRKPKPNGFQTERNF